MLYLLISPLKKNLHFCKVYERSRFPKIEIYKSTKYISKGTKHISSNYLKHIHQVTNKSFFALKNRSESLLSTKDVCEWIKVDFKTKGRLKGWKESLFNLSVPYPHWIWNHCLKLQRWFNIFTLKGWQKNNFTGKNFHIFKVKYF